MMHAAFFVVQIILSKLSKSVKDLEVIIVIITYLLHGAESFLRSYLVCS